MSPAPPIEGGRVARALGRALAALAAHAHARPGRTLALVGAVTLLALFGARRLSLDTDLSHLLPADLPSVRALSQLEARFDGIGYVVVVGRGADVEALRRFADDVAPRLEALDTVRYVEARRPVAFVRDRAAYFLDLPDLKTIQARVAAREQHERKRRNPMHLDLEEAEAPPLDFADLEAKYRREAGRDWLGRQGDEPYYLDAERGLIAVLAKPTRRASDMAFARRVVDDVQALVATLDAAAYGPDFEIALTGRYVKKVDQQAHIQDDLALASAVALGLMLLFLMAHFRRPGAVVLVLGPLGVGLAWTFGVTALVFGTLNLLTGFIGAILLGLGIDHGIHLPGRYQAERAHGAAGPEAVATTFGETGRAVVVAGLTTAFAFAGVALSDFRAFREFGVVAALGSTLVVLAYATLPPALLALVDRGARPRPVPASTFARALPRWTPAVMGLGLPACLLAFGLLPRVTFDYDLGALEDADLPSFRLDQRVNRLLGYSQTPAVVLTDDAATERATLDAFRRAARPDSTIDFVAGVADLVPPDQPAKRAVLDALRPTVERAKPSWLTEDLRPHLEDARRMVAAAPFGRADLPPAIRRQFQGPDATAEDGFVLVFPAVSLSDGAAVRRFAAEVRGAELPPGAPVAGEAMILADLVELVIDEAPRVLTATVVLVLGALWLLLGRLTLAILCAAPAALTVALTLALIPVTPLALNFLSVVMLPVLFGLGVDAGVHLVTRLARSGDAFAEDFAETARAIAGAVLTTMLGFGALLLADHPGLASLGALAVAGLAVNLLVCLVLLGGAMAWWRRPHADVAEHISTVGLSGYAPIGPGTVGAFASLPFAWWLTAVPMGPRVAVAMVVTIIAYWAVLRFCRDLDPHADPQEVVVDEFVGCLLATLFVPAHAGWFVADFVLFRAVDMVKPWPVNVFERRLPGGWGVMGDDVAAGLMAGGLLMGVRMLLP